ncbi:hypothetical protein NF867_18155 [Solitalea sp. MAHUQ-68]|uniref:Prolyl-tRNA synthetase n=1 Tax=Solitalea agri TaxID=2953739 RepID=A0A9X2F4Y5_9SPHI|nr:hypothetical protein [Solitalea agri]MCO4294792.1 hypothetical protein [Solitalea agri]
MKRFLTLAIMSTIMMSSCSSSKMAQNTPSKESVDNDLYFTDVKLSEKPIYSSNSQAQNSVPTEEQGPLTRYYDPNDPDYYYANRINKFYYPSGNDAYFDDYYNPYSYYSPYNSWSFGVGAQWGSPYYGSSYYMNRPFYYGMPSTYFSMSFGWVYPSYGYGYGYSPYYYNNYLGYYYNQPWYSGGYYPGYYVYNVSPAKVYNNYGPRTATGGSNINRPRAYRGGTDAFIPSSPRVNEVGSTSTRPAWRPDNSNSGSSNQAPRSEARPRERSSDGGSTTRESRPTYVAPRSTEGSRSSGGESRSSGGSSSSSPRPRGRN